MYDRSEKSSPQRRHARFWGWSCLFPLFVLVRVERGGYVGPLLPVRASIVSESRLTMFSIRLLQKQKKIKMSEINLYSITSLRRPCKTQ